MRLEFKHGGILTENIVQAVARDLMVEGGLRLEANGYQVLISVHDELICERRRGRGYVKKFETLMCQVPRWADKKLPLQAKAWEGMRYRK